MKPRKLTTATNLSKNLGLAEKNEGNYGRLEEWWQMQHLLACHFSRQVQIWDVAVAALARHFYLHAGHLGRFGECKTRTGVVVVGVDGCGRANNNNNNTRRFHTFYSAVRAKRSCFAETGAQYLFVLCFFV